MSKHGRRAWAERTSGNTQPYRKSGGWPGLEGFAETPGSYRPRLGRVIRQEHDLVASKTVPRDAVNPSESSMAVGFNRQCGTP